MNRKKLTVLLASLGILILLLAALLLLSMRTSLQLRPFELLQETEPTPEPTVHVHRFDPETHICPDCGETCGHTNGFDAEHRCRDCGWLCPHETHDKETAACPVCGAQFNHHFGMDGVCDVCGAEAVLYTTALPERYFAPAAHTGRCLRDTLTLPDGLKLDLAVYLPWDYNTDTRYNVAVMLHGDGGSCDDWTDATERTPLGDIQFHTVYDNIVEEHLCDPFIVVGIDNRYLKSSFYGEGLIEQTLLPYLARSFSTWMEGESYEQIAAAREHLAIGGLSRGSIYTYGVGMTRCLDVAANFCCFSNGYIGDVPRQMRAEGHEALPILSYIATVGLQDEYLYVRAHRYDYEVLCTGIDTITDGENARMFEIDAGHNFITWTTSFYNALLLMF